MPTKAASKPAAKPAQRRKPARAAKPKPPLTLYSDTSAPGGQTIKALFEAAGHTVIDRKPDPTKPVHPFIAECDAHYAELDRKAAQHDKPATDSVQDERIRRIEQDASARDLCIGKLQTRVDELVSRIDLQDKFILDHDKAIYSAGKDMDDLRKSRSNLQEAIDIQNKVKVEHDNRLWVVETRQSGNSFLAWSAVIVSCLALSITAAAFCI